MKSLTLLCCALMAAFVATAGAQTRTTPQTPTYVENRGQWNSEARYLFRTGGIDLWLTNTGIVYDLHTDRTDASATVRTGYVTRMTFKGASKDAVARAAEAVPGTINFLTGNDPSKWVTGVRAFRQMAIPNLYNGINALMYIDGANPRYDLVVEAGADPSQIRIEMEGAAHPVINRAGELVYSTPMGDIRQSNLKVYQLSGGVMRTIESSFKLNSDGTVGFKLGSYDRTRTLVIDPIIYSTYIASADMETPYDIAVDGDGNTYLTGMTASTTYPVTVGAYKETYQGGSRDAIITKLDADGSALVYSTYLGGSGQDIAFGIAIDNQNDVYVTGTTTSPNFPTTAGAYQTTPATGTGVLNSFITKLNATGSALVFSTYVQDVSAADIVVGSDGSSYITGSAASTLATTTGARQETHGGGASDAFVLKLNSTGAARDWATFLGGRGVDRGSAITLGKSGGIYITGITDNSDGFPTSQNAYQGTLKGDHDAFVSKLTADGTTLDYSTLIGGSSYDMASSISVDASGSAYITGTTKSENFPTSANAFQTTHGGSDQTHQVGDAFVTKLKADGSGFAYSTLIGGVDGDAGQGIFVDTKGYAYVAGYTGSTNFPTTTGAYTDEYVGAGDAFYVKVNDLGTGLLYSTFLGGTGSDTAMAMTVDKTGNIYLTGQTQSTDFPKTDAAFDTTAAAKKDIFVTKFPGVLVTSPNGEEVWCAGSTQMITWATSGIPSFDVYISSDSGRTYNLLAAGVNGTSYQWPIPPTQVAGMQYQIQIRESGSQFVDFGDTTFTINSLPQIVQQPGSTTRPAGGSATFTAAASSQPTPDAQWQVSTDGGQTWADLTNETKQTLTLNNVQPTQSGNSYRAVFTNSCGSATSQPAVLTVVTVTVLTPNGGQSFCSGTTQTISWSLAGFTGASNFSISISSDGGQTWGSLVANLLTNSYEWNIPTSQTPSTQYRVRVTLQSGGVFDVSDSNFTINGRANVTRNPENFSGEKGVSATFTSEASGLPEPALQWQVSTNNGQTWTNINGGSRVLSEGRITTKLTVANIDRADSGKLYRTVFSNDCGNDTTNSARLAVFSDNPTGVDDPTSTTSSLSLAVTPNPTTDRAEFHLRLPRAGEARLIVTDINGRQVRELSKGSLPEGETVITLDGTSLPSGTYACTLLFNGERRTVKLSIMH